MKSRDDALLRKIIEYCNEAEAPVDMFGDDIEAFSGNIIYRNACCMPVLQIGELCKLISNDLRESHQEVDWHGWCGIRDVFAHQYTNLDIEKTWIVLRRDIPIMKKQCQKILSTIDENNISRIKDIINKYQLNADAELIYEKISKDSGVSLNAFSDDQLKEFISLYK